MVTMIKTSIVNEEVARFTALADQWWDPVGDFAPLHKINPVRLNFIRNHLCELAGKDPLSSSPLEGLSIIDVGCGGGLLCEPLSRLGASVTGIDPGEKNVCIAANHAASMGLDITYQRMLPEELAAKGIRFDAVINLEVIEHVSDKNMFMEACCALVKPGGAMVGATINRTLKSLFLAKIGAEYILRWLPRGTHDWRTFVKPSEFSALLRREGLAVKDLTGLVYNPFFDEWASGCDLAVNYMIYAVKQRY